jgi:hypothetical protein
VCLLIYKPRRFIFRKQLILCNLKEDYLSFKAQNPEKMQGFSLFAELKKYKKSISIPVTGCGGPYGCEMSRLPHFLDNRLTDGEVVSLMHWPPFTPRKIPGTHFCQRLSLPQGHRVVGRIRSI